MNSEAEKFRVITGGTFLQMSNYTTGSEMLSGGGISSTMIGIQVPFSSKVSFSVQVGVSISGSGMGQVTFSSEPSTGIQGSVCSEVPSGLELSS